MHFRLTWNYGRRKKIIGQIRNYRYCYYASLVIDFFEQRRRAHVQVSSPIVTHFGAEFFQTYGYALVHVTEVTLAHDVFGHLRNGNVCK